MPLNLYRRHQGKCEAGHPLDKRTSEFEERKKGSKKCGCYIFPSGALGGKYRRKYTGSTDWAEAEIVAAEWEKAAKSLLLVPFPSPRLRPRHQSRSNAQSKPSSTNCAKVRRGPRIKNTACYSITKISQISEQRGYVMIDQCGRGVSARSRYLQEDRRITGTT